jgi:flagellar secretion chaperone FliS
MNPKAAQNYFRTRVLTATPEQLQMMLFDGALRFGEQARAALEAKNWESSHSLLTRMQNVVMQLNSTLKHDVHPELCGKLAGLYNYAYRRLVEANMKHRLDSLDDALRVLRYQRETWAMVQDQLAKTKAGAAARSLDMPAPDHRMEARISMQG